MPKTRSRSTTPHRGPRHEGDPDRRVKYVLRFRRRGEDTEPQLRLVRRGRRPDERELSPAAARQQRRATRRRERHQVHTTLGEVAKHVNATAPGTD